MWHIADAANQWFSPSNAPFMINYRVDDLDQMPDGNKVELWEPMIRDEANRGT